MEQNVITVYVRPQRHTNEFIQKFDHFSLSFYLEEYKDALTFCGRHSGRDVNKAKEAHLSPVFKDSTVFFSEAKLVCICKKIYED